MIYYGEGIYPYSGEPTENSAKLNKRERGVLSSVIKLINFNSIPDPTTKARHRHRVRL